MKKLFITACIASLLIAAPASATDTYTDNEVNAIVLVLNKNGCGLDVPSNDIIVAIARVAAEHDSTMTKAVDWVFDQSKSMAELLVRKNEVAKYCKGGQ